MSNTTTPIIQSTSSTTPAISIPVSTPSIPTASKFSVSPIPAFKKPINYAAAASSKSKLSPPAVNGKEVNAVIQGTTSTSTTTTPAVASIVGVIPPRKVNVETKPVTLPTGTKVIRKFDGFILCLS